MKKSLSLILLFVFLFSPFRVYADTFDLPSIKIAPNSFFYPLKRISEKVVVYFYFDSNKKADYYQNLVQVRLAELKYIVDKDFRDQVERSTQRVSYQIGILTDYVVGKKLNNKQQSLADLYKSYRIILEKLRDKYPENSSYWMLVQHIINSIDLNLRKF